MKTALLAVCAVLLCTIVANAQPPLLLQSGGPDVPFYWIVQARPDGFADPVTLQLRLVCITSTVWFEAWAPYDDVAVGRFLGDQNLRRPVPERTNFNKNVALSYATWRILSDLYPATAPQFTAALIALGLDPENTTRDPASPIGIGNLAADAVLEFFHADGMNQKGDLNGRTFHRQNYSDYTGYAPVNTFDTLVDPDVWQPLVESNGRGEYNVQKFLTPQGALIRTFGMDTSGLVADEPTGLWANDRPGYRARVREVIKASRKLTEKEKLLAEYYNNKFASIGEVTAQYVAPFGFTLDNWIKIEFLVNSAAYDSVAPVWRFKREFDIIRPVSAIRFIKHGAPIRAWGGPGLGTVTMKGDEFTSYLRTMPFPEYPSGTTCICETVAEALRGFGGENFGFGFSKTFVAGTSEIEPGFTPAQNLTVNYATLTEFAQDCGQSRLWGGVHYQIGIDASRVVCPQVGAAAFQRYDSLVNGVFTEEPTTPINC